MAWVVDEDTHEIIGEVDGGGAFMYDVDGDLDQTVGQRGMVPHGRGGAPRTQRGTQTGRHLPVRGGAGSRNRFPPHPGGRASWDKSLHGVSSGPDEYMWPMPLTPSANNGIFTAAVTEITYEGEPQKPFKGERILSIVARSGASALVTIPVTTGLFVGVDLQQLQQGNIPVEFWPVQAFGVRLHMKDSKPGIDINFPVVLTTPLAGTDTVTVLLMILGRLVA